MMTMYGLYAQNGGDYKFIGAAATLDSAKRIYETLLRRGDWPEDHIPTARKEWFLEDDQWSEL